MRGRKGARGAFHSPANDARVAHTTVSHSVTRNNAVYARQCPHTTHIRVVPRTAVAGAMCHSALSSVPVAFQRASVCLHSVVTFP